MAMCLSVIYELQLPKYIANKNTIHPLNAFFSHGLLKINIDLLITLEPFPVSIGLKVTFRYLGIMNRTFLDGNSSDN